MPRPKGSRTSKNEREARKAKAIELQTANPTITKTELAAELGVTRMTLWNDLQDLEQEFIGNNLVALGKLKALLRKTHLDLAQEVHDGILPPDASTAIRGHLVEIAKIEGAHAPTRHLTAKVDATIDPEALKGARRFAAEASGLSEAELEPVWELIRQLKAVQPAIAFLPPEATS